MDCPPLTLIFQVPCHEWRKSHPWTCSRKKFQTVVCTATERERTRFLDNEDKDAFRGGLNLDSFPTTGFSPPSRVIKARAYISELSRNSCKQVFLHVRRSTSSHNIFFRTIGAFFTAQYKRHTPFYCRYCR